MLFTPSDISEKTEIRKGRRPFGRGRRHAWAALLLTGCCSIYAETTVLETEHLDLRIIFDAGASDLSLTLHSHDHGRDFPLSNAVVRVAESARLTLPSGTIFGEAGESLWVLPQSQDPALPYLGLSAEGLPGIFAGAISVALASVEGPGHFYMWQANQFGALEIKMNSRNGIDETDQTAPFLGSHEHQNWGFTTSGFYRVAFVVTGRLSGQETNIVSLPQSMVFEVLPLPIAPEKPFRKWQKEMFGQDAPSLIEDPGQDPDGDGQSNAAEYAFGSDPLDAKKTGRARIRLEIEEGKRAVVIELPRVVAATDVRYSIEASKVLESSQWENIHRGSNSAPGGDAEWMRIRVAEDSMEAIRFFRIGAELH